MDDFIIKGTKPSHIRTELREPPSGAALHRVVRSIDPEALEDMLGRRLARALAADGKRIRGANRNGHHETVALVDHASGAPFALLNFDDGEPAATHDLLKRTDVRGKVITLDALHTTRKTATLITRRCGADHIFPVKGNAPATFDTLDGIDREANATGRFKEARPASSSARYVPIEDLINYPGVSRIARIKRYRKPPEKSASGAASGNNHTGTSSPRSMRNTRRQRNCCGSIAGTGPWKT